MKNAWNFLYSQWFPEYHSPQASLRIVEISADGALYGRERSRPVTEKWNVRHFSLWNRRSAGRSGRRLATATAAPDF
ncbi:hypothetical protein GC176_05345 [bacterium]|nr:hypothetical protein [bacterium]